MLLIYYDSHFETDGISLSSDILMLGIKWPIRTLLYCIVPIKQFEDVNFCMKVNNKYCIQQIIQLTPANQDSGLSDKYVN